MFIGLRKHKLLGELFHTASVVMTHQPDTWWDDIMFYIPVVLLLIVSVIAGIVLEIAHLHSDDTIRGLIFFFVGIILLIPSGEFAEPYSTEPS